MLAERTLLRAAVVMRADTWSRSMYTPPCFCQTFPSCPTCSGVKPSRSFPIACCAWCLFDQGLKVDPSHLYLWQAWGVMEYQLGNFDEARRLFQEGVWADPSSKDVVYIFQVRHPGSSLSTVVVAKSWDVLLETFDAKWRQAGMVAYLLRLLGMTLV